MMRYAEVPWPWAGLTLALVLLAQEGLLKFVGDSPSLALTSWRILVMTIGVTSLALIILPPRRPAYLLGKKLPRSAPAYVTVGEDDEAQEFAYGFLACWRDIPGAFEWLAVQMGPRGAAGRGARPQ